MTRLSLCSGCAGSTSARPKTDKLDAVWLAKVVERGMCRPSLVHPKPIRQLRDLTRYRRSLVRERSREKQRLEKTLEDAQIKLDTVVASLLSVSGRAMIEAMIAGERDPHVLAGMARGVMRRKIPQLEKALRGYFDDHHGFICATMLGRIDALAADIAALDARIAEVVTPHLEVIDRLDEVPGVGARSAQELIAEIGLDMAVFPTAAHLVSWARFAPSTPNPRDGARPVPPARATHGWRPPSARWWRRCLAPTPSSVTATGGCPGAAARNAPSSPSATPS